MLMLTKRITSLVTETVHLAQKMTKSRLTKAEIRQFLTEWAKFLVVFLFICFIYLSEVVWVLCLLGFILTILILICVTSFLWVPLLLIWGPIALLSFCFLSYTRIGDLAIEFPIQLIEILMHRVTWRRKTLWFCFYEIVGWYAQKMQNQQNLENNNEGKTNISIQKRITGLKDITCQNLGYAWITETGDVPKSFVKMPDKCNQRQYQLYDYCATNMIGQRTSDSCVELSGSSVLDLGCGRGGGLKFLAKNYNIHNSIGIDISQNQIIFAQDHHLNPDNVEFGVGDVENIMEVGLIKEIMKEEHWTGFDLITSIENIICFDDLEQFLINVRELMIGSFKAKLKNTVYNGVEQGPTFVIADLFMNSEIETLENTFSELFQIRSKENASHNVRSALELDQNRTLQIVSSVTSSIKIQNILRKFLSQRTLSSLKKKEQVYMIYVLKLKADVINQMQCTEHQSQIDIQQDSETDRLFNYSYCSVESEGHSEIHDVDHVQLKTGIRS